MASSITGAKLTLCYPWMFGKRIDLLFFFLPVLLGLSLYYLTLFPFGHASVFWGFVLFNAFGAGPFHQGATWFAYFDASNRRNFRSSVAKSRIFFWAPPIILLLTIVGAVVLPSVTLFVWICWSLQHLVQQNVGILLLYHNHGKGEAIVARPLEMRTQWSAAIVFFLIFFYRVLLKAELAVVMIPLIAAASLICFLMIGQYFFALNAQIKSGAALNVPALTFWALSVLTLSPLAFLGKSFEDGYLVPITCHWFQYIALNCVLVHNKYRSELSKDLPLAKPMALFASVCLTMVLIDYLLLQAGAMFAQRTVWKEILVGALLGLGNIHYFLDAFLWRFREPYQRQAILPYLIAGR